MWVASEIASIDEREVVGREELCVCTNNNNDHTHSFCRPSTGRHREVGVAVGKGADCAEVFFFEQSQRKRNVERLRSRRHLSLAISSESLTKRRQSAPAQQLGCASRAFFGRHSLRSIDSHR